ncbi:MAG: glycoside hydrolase family 3 C-terminal domain-containing protein [Bacteroidales bacterium]|nr:glycoside hydrolase family 3 C-terminal domain-containing protein [Bacteroidales bacterium]
MTRKVLPVLCLLAAVSCGPRNASDLPAYLDVSRPLDERVEDALGRMTLEEKVKVIHAQSKFSSYGVPRLGIPELWTDDGPHGVRPEVFWDEWNQAGWTNDSCTAFPALTCLAATWNTEAAGLYGKSVGEEARYRRKDVLLGPGVNIYRTPLNGRNFEYMGEDPCLSSSIVVPYVQGLQSNGVAACVKHFALNNQENPRMTVNVNVDDRALYEIYLPAFKAAVQEGGAWSIMGSYNCFEGQHCCHNDRLLNQILKGEWGFDGAVLSDWGGTHDTDQAASNGLDLEFGTWTDGLTEGVSNAYDNYFLANPYLKKLRSGELPVEDLDDKVRRVLRLNFRTAMNPDRPYGSLNSPEHLSAARQIADEGIVLLKNDGGLLPFDPSSCRIAVIGENAVKMMTVGGGSSSLKVVHEVLPLEGIEAVAGDVVYERGYVGDVTGIMDGVTTGQDLNDKRSEAQLIADAVKAAQAADAVIFIGGLNKSEHQDCEGTDRLGLGLPYAQDKVIEALAEANSNIVVVLVSGNAVAMPWIDKVPTVVQAWYLGSEAGNAIADVIFGKVNPSGKLPFTFPVRLVDSAPHALDAYDIADETTYKESIFVGYRWHEKQEIAPLFAFGHGLSYTTFEYSNVRADKQYLTENGRLTVSVDVTNAGDRQGKEVVQLYIGENEPRLPRPVKELKAFSKVDLQPGESTTVSFDVDASMLRYFDDAEHCWKADPGRFTAYVAAASDDVRGTVSFDLK